MRTTIGLALALLSSAAFAQTYLGNTGNRFNPNSINNPYGQHGSQYAPNSIRNPYSQFGNPYSNTSATNPYALNAPKLYDQDGNYRGKLSANPYDPDSTSNPYGRFGSPYSSESINNPYAPVKQLSIWGDE